MKTSKKTYLSFWELQLLGELGLALNRNVATKVKLLFQLDALRFRVDNAVLVFGARFACFLVNKKEKKRKRKLVMLLGYIKHFLGSRKGKKV